MSPRVDRHRLRRAAPYLYLLAIAITLSATHVARYHELSPIDELRHVDYAMSVTHLKFVRLGDRLSQEAMREEACRGVDLPGWIDPPCRSARFESPAFRDDGYQTASAHPPTYYLVVGLVSRATMHIGLFSSFVDPARLMGGLLLGIGLALTYLAGLRLGLRPGALLAALTLMPATAAVLHASATVNPDATAVFAGGLVLYAAVAWEQRRLPTWGLAAAGAIAGALKLTNLLAVAVMAAWLLLRSPSVDAAIRRVSSGWAARRLDRPQGTAERDSAVAGTPSVRQGGGVAAAVLLASGVVVSGAWSLVDRLRATIDPAVVPQNQNFAIHGLPAWHVTLSPVNLFGWFRPGGGYAPPYFNTTAVQDARTMITLLFVGAMLVATLQLSSRWDSVAILAATGTAVALIAAPVFVLVNAVVSHVLVGPTPRYGISLLPVMVIVLASLIRGRLGTRLLGSFAVITYTTLWITILLAHVPKPVVH